MAVAPEAAAVLALVALAFVAGAMCPVYYAMERFRGFGRAMIDRLPYQPPPGADEEAALVEATTANADPDLQGGGSDGD